jgi:hemerythrin-like domain-containing protein
MAIQIGAKPESDFTDPIGLLSDCHRRIERFLDQLIRLSESDSVLSEHSRNSLERALRYFRTAAPRHTEDEEESLFPRLQADGSIETRAILSRMATLESDHRGAESAHAVVDRIGLQWLAEGSLPSEEGRTLISHLRSLHALYRIHISFEDNELFPLARRILEVDQIEQIGREMAARRGLDYDQLLTLPGPRRAGAKAATQAA